LSYTDKLPTHIRLSKELKEKLAKASEGVSASIAALGADNEVVSMLNIPSIQELQFALCDSPCLRFQVEL
jgi:hypothetical protein